MKKWDKPQSEMERDERAVQMDDRREKLQLKDISLQVPKEIQRCTQDPEQNYRESMRFHLHRGHKIHEWDVGPLPPIYTQHLHSMNNLKVIGVRQE